MNIMNCIVHPGAQRQYSHNTRSFLPYCSTCKTEIDERSRFEKAEKFKGSEYERPVFHNDEFYSSVSDLLDQLEADGAEVPMYCYGSYPAAVSFSAERILEQAFEDAELPDGPEDVTKDQEAELQAFLDEWSKKIKVNYHWEDFRQVVLLLE